MKEVIMQVADTPTGNPKSPFCVTELVRCGNCRHWDGAVGAWTMGVCNHWDEQTDGADYCSYGEPKERQ